MLFRQMFEKESSTYTYFLADLEAGEAILIDPVNVELKTYLELLQKLKLKLKYTFETHVHADHITASGQLRDETGCETVIHESAAANCISIKLKDGDELQFGKYKIKLIHTPGHTPCSSSYWVEDRVFTGDCLLINGCGRTDFQNGSAEEQWHSITSKLFALPPDTLVYPGHDYKKQRVSSVAQERDLNPRLAGKSMSEFINIMNNLNLAEPKMIHEAVPANQRCGKTA